MNVFSYIFLQYSTPGYTALASVPAGCFVFEVPINEFFILSTCCINIVSSTLLVFYV